jgi:hypothetical protein
MHDGQISQNLSSPSDKNISLPPSGKSVVSLRASHPRRGGSRVVTNARWDAMDATASGAQWDRRAGLPVSDRLACGRTALLTDFDETLPGGTRPGGALGEGVANGEVVWSWRPDAGVKFCARCISPDRVRNASVIREATVANKPVTGESTK